MVKKYQKMAVIAIWCCENKGRNDKIKLINYAEWVNIQTI